MSVLIERLQELKKEHSTWKALAKVLGVSTVTLGHWMTGRHEPRYGHLKKLGLIK